MTRPDASAHMDGDGASGAEVEVIARLYDPGMEACRESLADMADLSADTAATLRSLLVERDAALADAARLRAAGAEALAVVEEVEDAMERMLGNLDREAHDAAEIGDNRRAASLWDRHDKTKAAWAAARRKLARLDALACAVVGQPAAKDAEVDL